MILHAESASCPDCNVQLLQMIFIDIYFKKLCTCVHHRNNIIRIGYYFRKRSHSASSSSGSEISDDVHIVSQKKRSYRDRDRKMDEVERLAEMERQR